MKIVKIIAAFIAAAALVYFAFADVFVLKTVEISGGNEREIIRASGLEYGASIFSVNAEDVRAGVNALGVYAFESVEIRYPGRVEIAVRERKPYAMMLHEERIAVLDENGVLIELLDEVPGRDLIYLSGLEIEGVVPGQAIESDVCRAVLSAVKESAAEGYVSELDLSDLKNLRIISRHGSLILLGDDENMNEKLAWMKAALQDLELRGESGGALDVAGGRRAYYIPLEN